VAKKVAGPVATTAPAAPAVLPLAILALAAASAPTLATVLGPATFLPAMEEDARG
jgi:hypothetical protein